MPGAETPFAPLWVDAPNAEQTLHSRSGCMDAALAENLAHLIRYGWVHLPGALTENAADALSREIDSVINHPECYIARRGRKAYAHPDREVFDDPTFRLIDYHVNSRAAQSAIFAPAIRAVLQAAFDSAINAFQCLTFHYGSQQAPHQDAAYVVVSEPLQFMASWIALEDVEPGCGELMYYSGSHKLDDFLFPGESKCWRPAEHGSAVHREFLQSIVQRSEEQGMPLQTFLPKKGDALIWASDLVHGGSEISCDRTRRSIVTHYCPTGVRPNFASFSGHYCESPVAGNCTISSRHYDLRQRAGALARLRRAMGFAPRRLQPTFMGSTTSQ